jgi:hypothetical protein
MHTFKRSLIHLDRTLMEELVHGNGTRGIERGLSLNDRNVGGPTGGWGLAD